MVKAWEILWGVTAGNSGRAGPAIVRVATYCPQGEERPAWVSELMEIRAATADHTPFTPWSLAALTLARGGQRASWKQGTFSGTVKRGICGLVLLSPGLNSRCKSRADCCCGMNMGRLLWLHSNTVYSKGPALHRGHWVIRPISSEKDLTLPLLTVSKI